MHLYDWEDDDLVSILLLRNVKSRPLSQLHDKTQSKNRFLRLKYIILMQDMMTSL